MAMADEDTQALHERFDLLKGAEHHKNSLIEVSVTATFSTEQSVSSQSKASCTAEGPYLLLKLEVS